MSFSGSQPRIPLSSASRRRTPYLIPKSLLGWLRLAGSFQLPIIPIRVLAWRCSPLAPFPFQSLRSGVTAMGVLPVRKLVIVGRSSALLRSMHPTDTLSGMPSLTGSPLCWTLWRPTSLRATLTVFRTALGTGVGATLLPVTNLQSDCTVWLVYLLPLTSGVLCTLMISASPGQIRTRPSPPGLTGYTVPLAGCRV